MGFKQGKWCSHLEQQWFNQHNLRYEFVKKIKTGDLIDFDVDKMDQNGGL